MPRAGQNNWVYLFQGMRYYAAAGFYGSQSSVYYPKLGRWEQNEPSDLDGGDVNTYRFEGNNPVSQIVSGDTGSLWSDYIAPAIVSTNWLFGNVSTGWLAQVSNFSAGAGDTVSIGLTQRFRTAVGYNDVVNSNSLAYGIGQVAGTGVNIGLGFANPCGAAGAAIRGINALQAFGGAVNYADNMMQGNYGTAALDALGVLGNLSQLSRSCFSGDTELMARGDWGQGWRRIDKIMEDDEVLSRPEGDPNGVVEWKHVEELFRRFGFMIHLHTDGQVIRTTMEHPFYVLDKGWVTAAELKTGDLLSSHDGQWVAVEEVYDTGDYEAVYNLRVADFHTYFVGGEDWGFSVWAHNASAAYGGAASNPAKAGDAESYSGLKARGSVGDALTPHHMPQAALGRTGYGEGGALMMPHAEHVLTRTYGYGGSVLAAEEAGVAFRTVLARDIRDVRSIAGSNYNQGLLDLIAYYRTNFPALMAK